MCAMLPASNVPAGAGGAPDDGPPSPGRRLVPRLSLLKIGTDPSPSHPGLPCNIPRTKPEAIDGPVGSGLAPESGGAPRCGGKGECLFIIYHEGGGARSPPWGVKPTLGAREMRSDPLTPFIPPPF